MVIIRTVIYLCVSSSIRQLRISFWDDTKTISFAKITTLNWDNNVLTSANLATNLYNSSPVENGLWMVTQSPNFCTIPAPGYRVLAWNSSIASWLVDGWLRYLTTYSCYVDRKAFRGSSIKNNPITRVLCSNHVRPLTGGIVLISQTSIHII